MTVLTKAEPEYRLLHRVADKLEPDFRKAFLAAFQNAKGAVTLSALEAAVEAGNVDAFDRLVPWDDITRQAASETQVAYRDGVERAANGTLQRAKTEFIPRGVTATFDIMDPRTIEYMRTQAAQGVREVTDKTKAAIRSSMTRAIERGDNPRRAARRLRDTVGLTERQARAADNFLARQLQDGNVTVGQAERRAERYRARLLKQRTETIARTESIKAANAGQHQMWEQLDRDGVIDRNSMQREWLVTPDDRLCDICAPLDGARVDFDATFSTSLGPVEFPPAHPRCRCSSMLVRRRN